MEGVILLKGGLTNQYLLPCTGGYLQVEAGDEKDYQRFLGKLKKAGVDPEEIRYLFLTHHHGDHAGFAESLRRASGCRVIAHREAEQPLRKGRNARIAGGGFTSRRVLLMGWVMSKLKLGLSTRFPPLEPGEDDLLVEGDNDQLLRSLGIPGKILHTPGHSPDSISLLLDDGSCFCGDAAMSSMQWLGLRYCCTYMADMEESYRSWRKLIDAGADTFYPAHGRPFPPARLEQYLGHFRQEDLITLQPRKS